MINLDITLLQQNKLGEARQLSSEILGQSMAEIEIDSHTRDPLFLLGETLERKAMKNEAIVCYRRAAHAGHEDAQTSVERLGERW